MLYFYYTILFSFFQEFCYYLRTYFNNLYFPLKLTVTSDTKFQLHIKNVSQLIQLLTFLNQYKIYHYNTFYLEDSLIYLLYILYYINHLNK